MNFNHSTIQECEEYKKHLAQQKDIFKRRIEHINEIIEETNKFIEDLKKENVQEKTN